MGRFVSRHGPWFFWRGWRYRHRVGYWKWERGFRTLSLGLFFLDWRL